MGSFVSKRHYWSVLIWRSSRKRCYSEYRAVYCHASELFFTSATGFRWFNQRSWFQQDQVLATCHTSNDSLSAVRENFGQKVISKRGAINWPRRSQDLSLVDFFLWGYFKSKVFNSNPVSLDKLTENIQEEMQNISRNSYEAVIENTRSRLQQSQNSQGSHLDDVI